jgi:hypothetical protein
MHQIKIIALVVVAVLLLSGLGATVISSRAAPTSTKAHAATPSTNKLLSPPSVQWEKSIATTQDTYARSVKQTTDGGYIVAGTINVPSEYSDIYLFKTDANGNKQWEKRWDGGGHLEDWGSDVQPTTDGGYIVVGTVTIDKPPEFSDITVHFVYVIKTDANGNTQWARRYCPDPRAGGCPHLAFHCYRENTGNSISLTADGGYIVVGHTDMPIRERPGLSGETIPAVYLFKLSPSGTKQWESWWGEPDIGAQCNAYSAKQTSDGGYIVAGYHYREENSTPDVWLIKVGADGKKQWDKKFHGALGADEDPYKEYQSAIGYSVLQTADGGYIVAGVRNATYHGSYGTLWIIKTDVSGNELWDKSYQWGQRGSKSTDNVAYSIEPTKDGGYIVVGYFGGGPPDVLLLKIDAHGNEQWHTIVGQYSVCLHYAPVGETETSSKITGQQTADGGYIAAYSSYTYPVTVTLVKLGPEQQSHNLQSHYD